ncbi:MAG: hypothetical protein QMC96_10085 [Methanomicrobiales archaeon]|nr:hypothetical protein [Methanomicrobiales archaeon]
MHPTDSACLPYGATLNRRREQGFLPFMKEHEKSGRGPVKDGPGEGEGPDRRDDRSQTGIACTVDLYIINASGILEFATFEPGRGPPFRQYPSPYTYLERIRLRGDCSRWNGCGDLCRLRKDACQPTPDHP